MSTGLTNATAARQKNEARIAGSQENVTHEENHIQTLATGAYLAVAATFNGACRRKLSFDPQSAEPGEILDALDCGFPKRKSERWL
jgi:hypothetical protein